MMLEWCLQKKCDDLLIAPLMSPLWSIDSSSSFCFCFWLWLLCCCQITFLLRTSMSSLRHVNLTIHTNKSLKTKKKTKISSTLSENWLSIKSNIVIWEKCCLNSRIRTALISNSSKQTRPFFQSKIKWYQYIRSSYSFNQPL